MTKPSTKPNPTEAQKREILDKANRQIQAMTQLAQVFGPLFGGSSNKTERAQ